MLDTTVRPASRTTYNSEGFSAQGGRTPTASPRRRDQDMGPARSRRSRWSRSVTSCRRTSAGAPACGGDLVEMVGQAETSNRITTVKLTYQLEHHVRQKDRCACNGAVVTAPGPVQVVPGTRYAPDFGVAVAVAKYLVHLPLERQVRMMAREGLMVESETLWDQLNVIARHFQPTCDALGRRAPESPVVHVDETRWGIMGSAKPAIGTVWTMRAPTVSFYRILPGKSAEEGRCSAATAAPWSSTASRCTKSYRAMAPG